MANVPEPEGAWRRARSVVPNLWRRLSPDARRLLPLFGFVVIAVLVMAANLSGTAVRAVGAKGAAEPLASALLAAGGAILAVSVALQAAGEQRAIDRFGALPTKYLRNWYARATNLLCLLVVGFGIAALVPAWTPSDDVRGAVLLWGVVILLFVIALLLPVSRVSSGRIPLARYGRALVAAMRPHEGPLRRPDEGWESLDEFLLLVAGSPYRAHRELFRAYLQSGDVQACYRMIAEASARHASLMRNHRGDNGRWILASWIRLFSRAVDIADENRHLDFIQSSMGIVGAMLVEQIRTNPSWDVAFSWKAELHDLCRRIGALGDQGAAQALLWCLERAQQEHFDADPGEEIDNQFHLVMEAYVHGIRDMAEAAISASATDMAKRCTDSLVQMCRDLLSTKQTSDFQRDRFLTWTLEAAKGIVGELAARDKDAPPWDAPAIHLGLLLQTIREPPKDYRHIPFVALGATLQARISDGTVPFMDWTDFRMALVREADLRDDFSKDVLSWGAGILENCVETMAARSKQGHLVGAGMVASAEVVHQIIPMLNQQKAAELEQRFKQVYGKLLSLEKEVGGITETTLEWPGQSSDRKTRNLIRASWDENELGRTGSAK